jgi:DNA invertase Pin-like site-specific DNA recombinase
VSSEKIRSEHLARPAFIYVRQSTVGQVRHHHESQRRQYGLADHARTLGWREVVVIDDDLGRSGASANGRVGFQRLVATVGLGQAGGVFGLEVSRLARNNRDWYQLLDLCGLMNTLIIDAEGIYDPRLLNDRLLLGLKGTMSEAELGWIRQRAHEGLLAKARRGELVLGLPVGYIHSADGRVEKSPDARVQHAIELVFRKFEELGSARQVLLWCRHEGLTLPVMKPDGATTAQPVWRPPVYGTILRFLQNPIYAGAYAFGRTGTRTHVEGGMVRKSRGFRRAISEWIVLLRDHHEPYIPWDRYERHQQVLADNTNMRGAMAKGAVRRGESLLAGLLRCGRCGRRLHVTAVGKHGSVARYHCLGAHLNHGQPRNCLSFGGLRVDEAIEHEVMRVLAPGAIEAALGAADTEADHTDSTRHALELELRQIRYEAERARRQYDAAEPENRLVVGTLERRWNAALERVVELEQRIEALSIATPRPGADDRQRLLALAEDFPGVWRDARTDVRLKKRIVRLVVEEIVANVTTEPPAITLLIHWNGGKHTQLVVRKNRTGQHRHRTNRTIIEVVRDLARSLPDEQIARVLNRLGYRTGHGNAWTKPRVVTVRSTYSIPVFDRSASGTSLVTMEQAAAALDVSAMTIRRLLIRRVLPGTQPVPYAPWTIRREDLELPEVRSAIAAIRKEGRLPQPDSTAQLSFINPTT